MKFDVNYEERGNYGNNRCRGNCSNHLSEDILRQYKLDSLSVYVAGGGTTETIMEREHLCNECCFKQYSHRKNAHVS